jgi:hypothetical protein
MKGDFPARLAIRVRYSLPAIQAIVTVDLEYLCRPHFALVTEVGIPFGNFFLFFGLGA